MADARRPAFHARSRRWPTRRGGRSWRGWRTGEATVGELAAPFAMSLPAVSRHLKVLERAGLIARGREAQWRPCRLAPEPLRRGGGLARELSPLLGGEPGPARRLSRPTCRKEIPMDTITDAPEGALSLHIERRLNAPRELVFAAWTEPRHLQALERAARLRDPGVRRRAAGRAGSGTRRCARRTARSCGWSAPTARSCRRSGWSSPTAGWRRRAAGAGDGGDGGADRDRRRDAAALHPDRLRQRGVSATATAAAGTSASSGWRPIWPRRPDGRLSSRRGGRPSRRRGGGLPRRARGWCPTAGWWRSRGRRRRGRGSG